MKKMALTRISTPTGLLVLLSLLLPHESRADLVSKTTVIKGNAASSAYVFQGARDMKRYKPSRITSSKIVPHFSVETVNPPSTVLTALATPEIQPKPRFGYGSDYGDKAPPQTSAHAKNPAPYYDQPVDKGAPAPAYPAPVLGEPVIQGQVIQFHSHYAPTEFWPVSLFHYDYHCSDYGYGPSFGPARLFSRIRSNIGIRSPFFSIRIN